MPAGLAVDGAHVDAGRAADAAQRRPSLRDRRAPAYGPRRAARGGTRSARRPPARRSRATCTGSSARRSPSAAAAGGARRGRATRRSTFSIPITVISVSGSVVHMRPLPSDSTTQTVPGLGDGEVRAGDRDAGAEERLAEMQARGRRRAPRARRRGRADPSGARNRSRDLVPVAVERGTRRCDGRSPASWTISSARSVSIAVIPASASASLSPISSVVSDFTLTTSSRPARRTRPVTISFASSASRAQCTTPPAATTGALERDEHLVEPQQRVGP